MGEILRLLRGVIVFFIVYSLAAFWSSIVLVRTILRFIRHPYQYRYVKNRPDQPDVLRRGFRHYFVDLPDGIKLHYVQVDASSNNGDGGGGGGGDEDKPLMLLLHGFPEFWYSWRHQLREFQNDFRVVAWDMRGYGESSKPKPVKQYRTRVVVEDLRLLLSALGKSRCVLVGHDWGGVIAWRFALRYPDSVDKLIIMNSPHPIAYTDSLAGLNLKQWLRSWYIFFFQCPYLPEIVFRCNDFKLLSNMISKPPSGCTNSRAFTEEDIQAWKYTFQQPGAMTAALNYYRALVPSLIWREDLGPAEQNLGSSNSSSSSSSSGIVRPPTLIIWGTNDIALGTSLAHSSLQYCQKGTLQLIEGASHWVQQDQPELVNQTIRKFLGK